MMSSLGRQGRNRGVRESKSVLNAAYNLDLSLFLKCVCVCVLVSLFFDWVGVETFWLFFGALFGI